MTNMKDIFTNEEIVEILRWKDLSFNVLLRNLKLPFVYQNSVVLAGGVYTNWHHNETIKDVDVFILDKGQKKSIQTFLLNKIDDIFERDSLKNVSDYKRDNTNIEEVINLTSILPRVDHQFIFTKYKTREELIKHFDFLHCTPNYYEGRLYVRRDAFEAIRDKKLIVHCQENQVEWRRDKFLKHRGFKEVFVPKVDNEFVPWSDYSKKISQNAEANRV